MSGTSLAKHISVVILKRGKQNKIKAKLRLMIELGVDKSKSRSAQAKPLRLYLGHAWVHQLI